MAGDDVRTGLQQVQHQRDRCHPGAGCRAAGSALEACQVGLQRLARGVGGTRIVEAGRDARGLEVERRGWIERRRYGIELRILVHAAVHAARIGMQFVEIDDTFQGAVLSVFPGAIGAWA